MVKVNSSTFDSHPIKAENKQRFIATTTSRLVVEGKNYWSFRCSRSSFFFFFWQTTNHPGARATEPQTMPDRSQADRIRGDDDDDAATELFFSILSRHHHGRTDGFATTIGWGGRVFVDRKRAPDRWCPWSFFAPTNINDTNPSNPRGRKHRNGFGRPQNRCCFGRGEQGNAGDDGTTNEHHSITAGVGGPIGRNKHQNRGSRSSHKPESVNDRRMLSDSNSCNSNSDWQGKGIVRMADNSCAFCAYVLQMIMLLRPAFLSVATTEARRFGRWDCKTISPTGFQSKPVPCLDCRGTDQSL